MRHQNIDALRHQSTMAHTSLKLSNEKYKGDALFIGRWL